MTTVATAFAVVILTAACAYLVVTTTRAIFAEPEPPAEPAPPARRLRLVLPCLATDIFGQSHPPASYGWPEPDTGTFAAITAREQS